MSPRSEDSTRKTSAMMVSERSHDDQIVLHVDADSYYAACERLKHPELHDEPVVVGMGYDKETLSGAVATASYEARDFGVDSGLPIGESLELLPRKIDADTTDDEAPNPNEAGHYRPVDMEFYEEIGEEIQTILSEYADTVEPVSIDESYLDITERTDWDTVGSYASDLQSRVQDDVGIPVSIGVAPTKSAAKVASDAEKPEGLVIVEPGDVQSFFEPLPIEAVHGIGPVTAEEMRDMGIETAGDLVEADVNALENAFGVRGVEVHQRAQGIDPRPVTPPDDPKSLSNESSFAPPTSNWERKAEKIKQLADKVTDRAQEKGVLYQTVGIKVVEPPYDVNTRARTLNGPIDNPELVESIALELLEEFDDTQTRKVGVKIAKLSFTENNQGTLSEWETDTTSSFDSQPTHEFTSVEKQADLSEF